MFSIKRIALLYIFTKLTPASGATALGSVSNLLPIEVPTSALATTSPFPIHRRYFF